MLRIIDRGSRQVRLANYPVTGSTHDEIRSSILRNKLVPGGLAGYTSLHFKTERTDTRTILGGVPLDTQIVVEYAIQITLPLMKSKTLTETIARDWNAYQQKLYLHELNHARIYFAAIDRVLGVRDPTRFPPIIEEAKRLSEGYDNATKHGIKEGCVLGDTFNAQDFGPWIDQALRKLASY